MTVNVSIVEQLRKTVSLHGWYCNIMRDQFLHSHVHDLLVTLLNLKITISSRRVSHVIFFFRSVSLYRHFTQVLVEPTGNSL